MRLELQMELLKPEIDIDYRRIIISYLKFALEHCEGGRFFEKFYKNRDNIVKDYCFSTVFSKPRFTKEKIYFDKNEIDERIYEKVMENKKEAVSKERVSFSLANAEEFQLPEQIDRIYFFNPFSVEILRKVMARIMESYYEHPRQILCFFYYPSDEYLTYLMTVDEMMFTDEIDCSDLFGGNSERERIMIFEIGQ